MTSWEARLQTLRRMSFSVLLKHLESREKIRRWERRRQRARWEESLRLEYRRVNKNMCSLEGGYISSLRGLKKRITLAL